MSDMLTADELEARLREIGAKRYHIHHPFHRMLHTGKCSKGQVQAWALNRYYYQAMIPLKDGSLIGRCEDSALRREWRKRLEDHDGDDAPARRHRTLAQADRWAGIGSGGRHLDAPAVAGHAFRGPGICALRARAQHAGGRRILPDGDVLAADNHRTHERDAGKLRLCYARDPLIFRQAASASKARRDVRARLGETACANARTTAAGAGYADVQMRCALEHDGCPALRLCNTRPDFARRLRAASRGEVNGLSLPPRNDAIPIPVR